MTVKDLMGKLAEQPQDLDIEFLYLADTDDGGMESMHLQFWDVSFDPPDGDYAPAVIMALEPADEPEEESSTDA